MLIDNFMPLIDEKYTKLNLKDEFLKDPLLMALAWKKSHDYIRNVNWFADNFELDVSAVDLHGRCEEWVRFLSKGGSFSPLELVPAPKTQPWGFYAPDEQLGLHKYKVIWRPEASNENVEDEFRESVLPLRPLAHIGIREQTIMTLVMMCMANQVETKQGDPSLIYDEVHEKGVVSYGSRLYCRYIDGIAEHSYGATTTYSKYFSDYRRFLERPYYFAKKELSEKKEDEEVLLVELDISRFFDCIDRNVLAKKIIKISGNDLDKDNERILLKNVMSSFVSWRWSGTALKSYGGICGSNKDDKAPMGLPQGLVASGFFANIYMEEFDDFMKSRIGEVLDIDFPIKISDYCRYVDDMRIVVVAPNRSRIDGICEINYLDHVKEALVKFVDTEIKTKNLKINKIKTKIEIFRGKSQGISRVLEGIQSNVSGPVSYEDAEINLGQLESIMAISSDRVVEQKSESGYFNRLAAIEKDMFDVREDTIKRFSANKITRLLDNIRHLTSRDSDKEGRPIPGDWDFLQERLARRFIACWSKDPSLVLLLKKGLELFPSPKLIVPVVEQLSEIMAPSLLDSFSDHDLLHERRSALARYCFSEIFRHSATVLYRKNKDAVPAHADVDGYFEILQSYAVKFISNADDSVVNDDENRDNKRFDLLGMQARFMLLVCLDTTLEKSTGCCFHDLIFKLAVGFRCLKSPKNTSSRDVAVAIIVARQLVEKEKPLLRSASSLLEGRDDAPKILNLIAIQDPSLFRSLLLHARPLDYKWPKNSGVSEISKKLYVGIRPSNKPLKEISGEVSLYKIISRLDNPFSNEIMAIKLMEALIVARKSFPGDLSGKMIDLAATNVQFKSFDYPPSFQVFDEVMEVKVKFCESVSPMAGHLRDGEAEALMLQRIGFCVRAALAGSGDATGFGVKITPKVGYRGIKTSHFKRQLGLLTTPESLIGEAAQFSGWLATLLSKLLRWPGIRVNDQGYEWPAEINANTVLKLIQQRLSLLRVYYCKQSRIPGLPELITPSWNSDKKDLVVAMVQSKMPAKSDFKKHGLFLNDPLYRVQHRRHLTRVAKLITKHVEAQQVSPLESGERERDVDLIVLPELSVHEDDMDVLIHLSRKTHAIVVAGLGFLNSEGTSGPNNCAVWVVPRKHNGNQNEVLRLQGKNHMTAPEITAKVRPWRPYQLMLEIAHPAFSKARGFVLTSAICFDSTDIALSADLRNKSNALLIPALNQDVNTFDSMVEALHYHMYQHVVLVNSGEFGGSYAMAPYEERHRRLIAHSSGNDQVTINTFSMNMFDFRRDGVGLGMQSGIKQKSAPAGVNIK